MSDAYLLGILQREAVDNGLFSPVRSVRQVVLPVVEPWANQYLLGVSPSGSFAKGTANSSSTDIDLFISLREDVPETLARIYKSLFDHLTRCGYRAVKRNVAIKTAIGGYDVDLVPGKRQSAWTTDHSLYLNRASTWTKTNIGTHISTVTGAGRQRECRILKLWRDQKRLEFPSFYLELSVIRALAGKPRPGTLTQNIVTCLEYFRDRFEQARILDPANGNNVISDDLTAGAKVLIRRAAVDALGGSWDGLVR